MRKYYLPIVTFFISTFQLTADPIPTLTIDSLTASGCCTADPTFVSWTAFGPGITVDGSGGHQTSFFPLPIGEPIGHWDISIGSPFGFPMGYAQGTITTDTFTMSIQLRGFGDASGSTDLLVEPGGVSFPATATGQYIAYACSPSEPNPLCTGPAVANVVLDLPGAITLAIGGAGQVFGQSFTSVPEASTGLLWLSGMAVMLGSCVVRQRRVIA